MSAGCTWKPTSTAEGLKTQKGILLEFSPQNSCCFAGLALQSKINGSHWPVCVCMYVQESLPEISREWEMHQRGPCVTLNICMFLGCVPLFQRLLFGKAFPSLFGCVCWFSSAQEKQWEESVSLSLSALFLSLTRLFVIFPPPTNPREAMLIKTYIAEAYATILFPGKPCQQHIQWLRRWRPGKSFSKCIRDQTYTVSARQLQLPLLSWTSDQPRTAGVLKW